MIQVIRSKDRYHADMGWLSTYWHFSFDHYHDPANTQWGTLRVFNDDTVQPGQGFGRHGHRDMEIVSVALDGALEHRDSLGNTGVLRAGEVQVMSAGSGIQHAEYNHSKQEPVHFLQLWILPRRKGLPPRWEQREFSAEAREGKLLPVVSSGAIPGSLTIDQDASIYLSNLRAGDETGLQSAAKDKSYLFVIRGAVDVNGAALEAGDQGRIADETALNIRARQDSEIILIHMQ